MYSTTYLKVFLAQYMLQGVKPLQLRKKSSPAGVQKVVGIVVGHIGIIVGLVGIVVGHIRWDGVAPRHLAQAGTKAIVGDQLCKICRKISER